MFQGRMDVWTPQILSSMLLKDNGRSSITTKVARKSLCGQDFVAMGPYLEPFSTLFRRKCEWRQISSTGVSRRKLKMKHRVIAGRI